MQLAGSGHRDLAILALLPVPSRNPLEECAENLRKRSLFRNHRSLLEETGWRGCWLHQCVLKNTLVGSKKVVFISRNPTNYRGNPGDRN